MSLNPSAKIFHYGQSIFEGMKAYKDANGSVFLFRPDENWKRLNKSAERLMMPAVSEDIFIGGLKKLLEIDLGLIKFCTFFALIEVSNQVYYFFVAGIEAKSSQHHFQILSLNSP